MDKQYKSRDISFEILEKAVNGDYFAMQEVIRLFKPYMARLSIHDGTRSPVNNIGQLLLRHPSSLPRPLDSESYIVKIKSSFISFNLHNIT